MVGFDDELIVQLKDVFTGRQSSQEIISIVGMGGIGKTTLARNVYEDLLIKQHFDIRAWATISQEYSEREILLELLSCQGRCTSGTVHELGEQLYKSLSGTRYLIILDDVWSTEIWDKIKFFFPDNGNSGRIVLTTRLSNVAIHCRSSCFRMNFLNEDKSWNLFCEKAFSQEGCPLELEEIGKKIVKKCKGLPMSIVVIGGHLRKSSRAQECWENVANDINSILDSGEEEQCLNILSLSYTHLPAHLKPCFLYIGIFPEDHEISVSELINLWIAEGFLKPNKAQSLEDVAEDYLKDLVDRNLILVRRWSWNGKIESCNIHDLLRELCLHIGGKEKFFCVLDTPRVIHTARRVVIHKSILKEKDHLEVFDAFESTPLVRSLICKGVQLSFDPKLLKVLKEVQLILNDVDACTLEANFQQVNLRYLDCNVFSARPPPYPFLHLPSSISLLWNLQTLIVRGYSLQIIAPSEIWEMPQLRHVEVNRICLPDPLPNDGMDQQDDFILPNLQTLLKVQNFRLSEEGCKRIPNIKELHVWYDDFQRECEAGSYYCPHNLGRFHKLESLKCHFSKAPNWRDFALSLTFPSTLQELTLIDCFLQWEDLTMIGSLPHLEVLELDWRLVIGLEWNPVVGEFLRLKYLKIRYNNLIYWNADSSHLPILENLVLEGLEKLEEIPSGIGEIPTLRCIVLIDCSVSAAISAMKILVEQGSLGNEGLQLEVKFFFDKDRESFREMLTLEGLKSKNLRLIS